MRVLDVPALADYWYPVAYVEDLADGPVARRVLGRDLVVWADEAGATVSAALDRCPHRSARLSKGWVDGSCLVCPYHGWTFGADGSVARIPQLETDAVPSSGALTTVHAAAHLGLAWVCVGEPAAPLPVCEPYGQPGHRTLRVTEEVWQASSPRVMDNALDPSHVSFVHRGSFGSPSDPIRARSIVEPTDYGMKVHIDFEVRNAEGHGSVSGATTTRVRRTSCHDYFAPFTRVLHIGYESGVRHVIFQSATPIDDESCRFLQFCVRNDTEEESPAEEIVRFDQQVIDEDRDIVESTDPDFDVDLRQYTHTRADTATIALRRILAGICGDEPGLAPVLDEAAG